MHPRDWITHLTREISPAAREELEQRRRAEAAARGEAAEPMVKTSPFTRFTDTLVGPAIRMMTTL